MDIVDRDLEKAERYAFDANFQQIQLKLIQYTRAASPQRFAQQRVPRPSHDQERALSSSGSSSSSSSVELREIGMSTVRTQRDLERHPTALDRIKTQRSQHQGTVGRGGKTRESRKPLPEFGGGKAYPPQLPAQEDFVVEFDGPDDPLHPQNWTTRKKWVTPP